MNSEDINAALSRLIVEREEVRSRLEKLTKAIQSLQALGLSESGEKEGKRRASSQRGRIRELLKQAGDSGLSSAEIVANFPDSNRATVYANINAIKTQGDIVASNDRYVWVNR